MRKRKKGNFIEKRGCFYYGFRFDRGSRSRESFPDRDRGDRERERARERSEQQQPGGAGGRNRMPHPPDRDHRDRYADSRGGGPPTKGMEKVARMWIFLYSGCILFFCFLLFLFSIVGNGNDHRYNERNEPWRSSTGSGQTSNSKSYSGSGSLLGNGNVSGSGSGSGNNWSQSTASGAGGGGGGGNRWNASSATSAGLLPLNRSLGSSAAFGGNSWTSSAPPPLTLSSASGYPSAGGIGGLSSVVIGGPSGAVNYSGDRYSRH